MLTVLLLMLTSQSPAVRRTTPASDDPGMVVRTVGTTTVNCTNCGGSSGGGWTPDGGNIGYMRMPDGGPLEVYTVNSSGSSGGGWVPDGGFIGSVGQGVSIDGGQAWNVTGTVSTTQGTSPWVVGTHAVTQGVGFDGGPAWNVAGTVSVVQGRGFDGGAAWGVTQSANDALRARTASEGDAGRPAGLYAPSLAGFRDATGALRDARVFDTDTSSGTEWSLGSSIVVPLYGGAATISGANDDQGNLGIAVYSIPIFNHSSPTNTAVTCSYSTPTLAPTTRRTSRSYISLKNTSSDQTVYIGGSSVSRANGYPLNPLESFEWRIVENTDYYCISGNADAGTIEIRVLEH